MRLPRVRPIGFFLLVVVALATGACRAAAATEAVDHHIYAELLSKHVAAGRVDYAGFKADEAEVVTGPGAHPDFVILSRDRVAEAMRRFLLN